MFYFLRHIASTAALLLLFLVMIGGTGCSTVQPCTDTPAEGNMRSGINSMFDEFAPSIYGDGNILFTTNREDEGKRDFKDTISKYGEDIYWSERLQGRYALPEKITNPPLNTRRNDGTATFFVDIQRKKTQMIFASFAGMGEDCNLFYSENNDGTWSIPKPLSTVNSGAWDSHPALSPDGSTMVFASDREGGVGGTDLYISFRRNDSLWTTPVNLGNTINSRFDEVSPAFADNNTLYYATRAYSPDRTFDIVFSTRTNDMWNIPQALPYPYNTQFDEITPTFWKDSVIFASNRQGGCGGFDLYQMRLCDEVVVAGIIDLPFDVQGPLLVYDRTGALFATVPVAQGQSFRISLPAREKFTFRLEDECLQGKVLAQDIVTPCSVTPIILNTVIAPPAPLFAEEIVSFVEIPFFLTGYYRPTTAENLAGLRLRAAYNLLTRSDSVLLTELSNPVYDAFSSGVERALDSIAAVIMEQFQELDNNCFFGMQNVEIIVEGFADPRPFLPNTFYNEADIADADMGVFIQKGQDMNNEILSLLRAYYSAIEVRRRLERIPRYARFVEAVTFIPRGRGVISGDEDFGYQRKINIKVRAVAKTTSSATMMR